MVHKKDKAVVRIAKRQRWCEDDARVIVESWRQSGESLTQFARRYGLRGERLGRWASRLEKPERNGLSFHRVHLVEAQADRRQGREPIEIGLTAGRSIRVPPGFAAEDLQQVLRVLEGEA